VAVTATATMAMLAGTNRLRMLQPPLRRAFWSGAVTGSL
jgi:hypothetical protein